MLFSHKLKQLQCTIDLSPREFSEQRSSFVTGAPPRTWNQAPWANIEAGLEKLGHVARSEEPLGGGQAIWIDWNGGALIGGV